MANLGRNNVIWLLKRWIIHHFAIRYPNKDSHAMIHEDNLAEKRGHFPAIAKHSVLPVSTKDAYCTG